METLIQASYLIAAALFILGLKQMSSPVTARRGILWAGAGMVLATLATFLTPEILDSPQSTTNIILIIVATIIVAVVIGICVSYGVGSMWAKNKQKKLQERK